MELLTPFFSPLSTEEAKSLQNIAESREPYVAEAYFDAVSNPNTVPGTVDVPEWGLLEEHADGLNETHSHLKKLLALVEATKAHVNDARYEKSHRYYKYFQDGADKIASAQTIAEKLSTLFASQGNWAKKSGNGNDAGKLAAVVGQ